MQIIDQTPFINHETGKINVLNRVNAILKYGPGWFKEIEGQTQVIGVMTKLLDKNYTLLRNVTHAGLGVDFPLVLVGPTGVFVMLVTALTGTFRAKGDEWGTISGNMFKDVKPNLLTRTERMARALQVNFQHQGLTEVANVDSALLCSDPSVHVDSLRPIIRIVMRDALERFIISITQARVVLTPDGMQKVIDGILNPPAAPVEQPPAAEQTVFEPEQAAEMNTPTVKTADVPPGWISGTEPTSTTEPQKTPSRSRGMSKKQWAFIIGMFVIWCLLVVIFIFLVIKGQGFSLTGLLP